MNNHRNLPAARNLWMCLLLWLVQLPVAAQSLEFVYADGLESDNAAVYRNVQLLLRDPHVFTNVPVFGCLDFTDNPIPVANVSFNGTISDMLTMDADNDGMLDLSVLQGLDRFDPDGVGQMVSQLNGSCNAPIPSTGCTVLPDDLPAVAATNINAGLCLQAIDGTTSGYSPPVPIVQDVCFVSSASDTELMLGGITAALQQSQFAYGWAGDQLMPGLTRGFLRESDADSILLPEDLPLIGGQPLSSILPGGQGNCAAGDDRDMLAGELGWWFYTEVTAGQVPVVQ